MQHALRKETKIKKDKLWEIRVKKNHSSNYFVLSIDTKCKNNEKTIWKMKTREIVQSRENKYKFKPKEGSTMTLHIENWPTSTRRTKVSSEKNRSHERIDGPYRFFLTL